MSKLKIGIIGVGHIAEIHIASYLKNENVELYAFCDINEERLKVKGEKYGVKHLYTDVNEMVKLEGLDAVSVCTWNCAHAKCSIAALNAGLNVLCEKPMCMNAIEAKEMLDFTSTMGWMTIILSIITVLLIAATVVMFILSGKGKEKRSIREEITNEGN